jgi:hypothetical protein
MTTEEKQQLRPQKYNNTPQGHTIGEQKRTAINSGPSDTNLLSRDVTVLQQPTGRDPTPTPQTPPHLKSEASFRRPV